MTPWVAEEVDDWIDPDSDEPAKVKTGWIEGVVEYAGCGSHRAEWKNPADFTLALAAPDLFEALDNIIRATAPMDNKQKQLWAKAEAAIAKARGVR